MPGGPYIVSGAGDTNINGTYVYAGQSSGKDYFSFSGVGGPYHIFWLPSNNWVLHTLFQLPANWQFINSAAAQPPLVGWSVGGSGTPPAGTLATIPETTLDRTLAVLQRSAGAVLLRNTI
jgi:hypothetical protein